MEQRKETGPGFYCSQELKSPASAKGEKVFLSAGRDVGARQEEGR